MGMPLYMQDYVKSLVALDTAYLNNPLVNRRFPFQRSTFDFTSGKHI